MLKISSGVNLRVYNSHERILLSPIFTEFSMYIASSIVVIEICGVWRGKSPGEIFYSFYVEQR